jgi:3-hydroxy-9,10-secoandrosta-1,3,5(10)-triene-9,17-dione monooxygenase reductase component
MNHETKVDLPVDAKEFRKALGAFATGVTIVTTHSDDGKDHGLTANSFNSVSLDPPMVLWSLGKTSSNLAAFLEADRFAVHVLAVEQEDLSNQFARSGTDKFSNCAVDRGAGDVPLLDGCVARFECRVAHRYEGGDHVIFVGEVARFNSFDRAPLVFQHGSYGRVVKTAANTESASAA